MRILSAILANARGIVRDAAWNARRVLAEPGRQQQDDMRALQPFKSVLDRASPAFEVDRTGQHDLAQLRALQDWFLRYELKSLPDVAEVASVGGMVRQYQVVLDPVRLASRGLTYEQVRGALIAANQETGGSVLELAEVEYMVRASGYLATLADFRAIPLAVRAGAPDLRRHRRAAPADAGVAAAPGHRGARALAARRRGASRPTSPRRSRPLRRRRGDR